MREIRSWKRALKITVALVAVSSFFYFLTPLFSLQRYGIRPRTLPGLAGILFSPFLHGDINHLTANSLSFLILGTVFFAIIRDRAFLKITLFAVLGGFGTWLLGRQGSNHIGMSGVIYGIMGYMMSLGFFEKRLSAILLSAAAFFLYGGALWGVLPGNPAMSWESHLCGFISGIAVAWFFSNKR